MTNESSRVSGGYCSRSIVAVFGVALVACAAVSGGPPVPPSMGVKRADLILNVVFDQQCPDHVDVSSGTKCMDLFGKERKNCGHAYRNFKVAFTDVTKGNAFSVYFDPSRPAIRTDPKKDGDITVDGNAPYIEYKFSVIGDACPTKVLDPTIIVEQ